MSKTFDHKYDHYIIRYYLLNNVYIKDSFTVIEQFDEFSNIILLIDFNSTFITSYHF